MLGVCQLHTMRAQSSCWEAASAARHERRHVPEANSTVAGRERRTLQSGGPKLQVGRLPAARDKHRRVPDTNSMAAGRQHRKLQSGA